MGNDPIILIVRTLGSLFVFIVLLRFLLQLTRADFYNPISQAVVKFTNPALIPLRRVIPGWKGMDLASIVLALLVKLVVVFVVFYRHGGIPDALSLLIFSSVGVLYSLLDIYFWSILIMVILSWVAPNSSHPGAQLIWQISEPVCNLARKVLPPIGGLDLSPILIFLAIQLIQGQLQPFAF
ncbi:YggT family protein [Balneatrix alpica]|uniref:YggT family protein n=1 Tax=Balneatrix alpica TaxID=75684 RepID=UPI0027390CB8|nr:YggT family protein [Balneatrix alpica]